MSESPSRLSHLDEAGRAHIVDVTDKAVTARAATASSCVRMKPETLTAIEEGDMPKGDVLAVARIAGIQAAKKCAELIPLCHPLPLSKVNVRIEIDDNLPGLIVTSETKTQGQTGVEMEALTAVSSACLTIYDMLKAAEKGMVISDISLIEKSGGRSGDWSAP